MKRVSIVGHFGGSETFTDGQTVKTKTLYQELSKKTKSIYIVDTFYKNKNPMKLIFQIFVSLLTSKNIIILLSGNGMKVFFPIYSFCAKYLKKNIYHDVIGGNLVGYIDNNPKFLTYLNHFKYNFVETNQMKDTLITKGVTNVLVIPNFRITEPISLKEVAQNRAVYEFCTFSRVTKEKGILDAIDAIEAFNAKHSNKKCTLDIYGSISSDFQDELTKKLSETSAAIQYKGEVPSSKATNVISKYYGLLFPTYWEGEGSAGTIIESFFAGVPVIATDWKHNSEMITHFQNGVIYPTEEISSLLDGVEWLVDNEKNMLSLKENCIATSRYYMPDIHIEKICQLLE